MEKHGLDIIILTNPANMFYLTGDGRLCAYAMVTRNGKVAIGVPQTDIKDVQERATMDHIVGFEDEVGMIHSLVVIAIGNCGLYTGQWGVREEDTVVIGSQQPLVLTQHPRQLGRDF